MPEGEKNWKTAAALSLMSVLGQPALADEPDDRRVELTELSDADVLDRRITVTGSVNGVYAQGAKATPFGKQEGGGMEVLYADVRSGGQDHCVVTDHLLDDKDQWLLPLDEVRVTMPGTCEEGVGDMGLLPLESDKFEPIQVSVGSFTTLESLAHFDQPVNFVYSTNQRPDAAIPASGQIHAVGGSYIVLKSGENYFTAFILRTESDGSLKLYTEDFGSAQLIGGEADYALFLEQNGGPDIVQTKKQLEKKLKKSQTPEDSVVDGSSIPRSRDAHWISGTEFSLGATYYYEELDMFRGGHNPLVLADVRAPLGNTQYFAGLSADFVIPVSSDERSRGGFGRALALAGRSLEVEGNTLEIAIAAGYANDYLDALDAITVGGNIQWQTPVAFRNCHLNVYAAGYQDLLGTGHLDPALYAGSTVQCRPFAGTTRTAATASVHLDEVLEEKPALDPALYLLGQEEFTPEFQETLTRGEVSVVLREQDSMESAKAELIRLEEEAEKLVKRQVWSGAEKNVREYFLIADAFGLPYSEDIIAMGCYSARALGYPNEYYERLKYAVDHEFPNSHFNYSAALDGVQSTYGWVRLVSIENSNDARLEVAMRYMDPELSGAQDTIREVVKESGTYIGLMPTGEYQYVTVPFEVKPISEDGRVTFVEVSEVPRLTRAERAEERRAEKAE